MEQTLKVLPEKMLRLMSPTDRKAIGQMSAAEALTKADAKNHRDLLKLVVATLRRKGIEPIVSRMDKRTTNNKGTPDILFAICTKENWISPLWVPCAWELKVGRDQLSVEQEQMAVRLQSPPNCWRWRMIRSLDDVTEELKTLGL